MPKRKRKKEDGSKDKVKYKGVQKRGEKRYQAYIHIDGKRQALGTFDTAKKAARAHDRAAMQTGRPPIKLNFQDKVPMDYKPKKKRKKSSTTKSKNNSSSMGSGHAPREFPKIRTEE